MNTDKALLLKVTQTDCTGTIPNLGIPNRKWFDVFSKSVKDEERVARRHATSQTRGDGVRPAVRAG
ncbi:hypothetical protein [Microcoleus sp. F4-D5]|uniref:hypothetical protein n=1 Tax=Microcoleus sp. F4-D5 TaxID=2818760 RepID=UPI002FCEE590